MNEGKLNNVTKEELLKYYNDNWSYESIGAIYGVSGSAIKKKLIKFGVSLPKKRKISNTETFNKGVKFTAQQYCLNCGKPVANNYKYCCVDCQREWQYKQHIDDWKSILKIIQQKKHQIMLENIYLKNIITLVKFVDDMK